MFLPLHSNMFSFKDLQYGIYSLRMFNTNFLNFFSPPKRQQEGQNRGISRAASLTLKRKTNPRLRDSNVLSSSLTCRGKPGDGHTSEHRTFLPQLILCWEVCDNATRHLLDLAVIETALVSAEEIIPSGCAPRR